MNPRLLLCGLILALGFSSGCLFSKKSAKPKDASITSEVEGNLKRRWVERRAAELAAQGVTPAAAQTQATREFAERFEFTGAAKK